MAELYAYFIDLWQKKSFPHAWQLKTSDANSLLEQLKSFIQYVSKKHTTVPFENNTDIAIIGLDKSVNISSTIFRSSD